MSWLENLHGSWIHQRRIGVLVDHLGRLFPENSRVLDVGCGDGRLARDLITSRNDLSIQGIDTLVRDETAIPVEPFDGHHLPFPDHHFDVVLFVDVLHHADDPEGLLSEARRVSRRWLVIKDHTRNGWAAERTLRFMDDLGNRRHGVALPYNYWSRQQWDQAFADLEITVDQWLGRLGLYPWPASCLFDRSLQFIAKLKAPAPPTP